MLQTNSVIYKLKPRSFNKFVHFWANLADFYPQCKLCLTKLSDSQVCYYFWAVLSAKSSIAVLSAKQLSHFKFKWLPLAITLSISTLVLLLRTLFNTISCFSNNLVYLLNTLQYSRYIHQRGQSSLRSLSHTIQPGQTVLPVLGSSIISVDNDPNWKDASATNPITNLIFNRLTSFTHL